MFKRISTLLLFLLPFSLAMADTITGQCGDSLYWSFDTENRHLDITGKGKMQLYKYPAWTTNNSITVASVSFPDSITSIDSYAFEEQELTEVIIPASVKKFGKDAFAQMPSLLRFEYEGEGYAESENGILYNCYNLRYFKGITCMLAYNDALDTLIVTYGYASASFLNRSYVDDSHAYDKRLFGKYDTIPKKIKTYFLPSELEEIGDFLLCYATNLGGITIPKKVHTIGSGAFLRCTSLDSLVFMSDCLQTIGDSAFSHCSQLSELSLPKNIQSIGHSAFLGCSSLDSLVFTGDGLQTIGDSAFCNCNQLAKISLQDTLPPIIEAHTFEGVDRSIPIHVPLGSSQRYKEAPYWCEFQNFIEPSPATYVDEVHVQHNATQKVFLNGQLLLVNDDILYNIMGQKQLKP
ncbi:MAG: leucine-rich repeat protein [Paludibacteraceae bacterium]|nr:leucine-rich repeat protein [Paludibacteraceae bacterium]